MSTDVLYKKNFESIAKPQGATNLIKHIILTMAKIFTFDVDAIAKSKDWPYLWSNKPSGSNQDKA